MSGFPLTWLNTRMPSIPRLTSPSSNRTCGFPASGSPGHSELSLKLLPQGGGTGRERGQGGWFPNAATIPPRCSVVALSGKRFSSHFVQSACPVRPLRSTGVTPLPGYYGPIRLPQGRYNGILGGLPGSSTDLSAHAAPLHPGEPKGCIRSLLDPWYRLHHCWKAGHSRIVYRGRFGFAYRCGLCLCSPRLRQADCSALRLAHYTCDEQLTW